MCAECVARVHAQAPLTQRRMYPSRPRATLDLDLLHRLVRTSIILESEGDYRECHSLHGVASYGRPKLFQALRGTEEA